MSTNSTIRIKRKDGTETGIYCHYDGYIEGVGVTLQLAYNTAVKVEKLLELGDLSVLGYYPDPDPTKPHSFEYNEQQENVCVAYHRDRGEKFMQTNDGDNEFVYIFSEDDACWHVETRKYISHTKASKELGIDYFVSKETSLLLDEIYLTAVDDIWKDDEFAVAGGVKIECYRKAVEARKEIIERRNKEHEALYRAYCD